jgi:cell wall-associated NlpC family hydrolase
VRRISAGDARPGDLVFFTGSGGVYHVGIYAGGGAVWHAPRPGEGVQREQIWTSSVFYGRP